MDSSPTLSTMNEACIKMTGYQSTSVIFLWWLYMDGVDCWGVEMFMEPNLMIH